MPQTTKPKKPVYLYVSPRLLCIMLALAFLLGVGLTLLVMPSGSSDAPESTAPPETTESPTEAPTEPPYQGTLPDLSDPLLLLVNRSNPLSADYAPALTALDNGLFVDTRCYDDLMAMLHAGAEATATVDGEEVPLEFVICSAYRTYDEQEKLFNDDVQALLDIGKTREEAIEEVQKLTMPAGCSEHQSGLAVDIVSASNQNLNETQAQTAEQQWLQAHCAEYGFVRRYPVGKEAVTDIDFESWHYRYVGREAAQFMAQNDLTLEELWALQ